MNEQSITIEPCRYILLHQKSKELLYTTQSLINALVNTKDYRH